MTWTGGKQSAQPGGTVGGENFLQLAQCWGDEPGSNGTRPDRRTCQYGGTGGWSATRDGNILTESIAAAGREVLRRSRLLLLHRPSRSWRTTPTVIVDETTAPEDKVLTNITTDASGKTSLASDLVAFNNNQYFTGLTTNEVKWAPSGADGTGSVAFELQTAMQSPGLGCGTPITRRTAPPAVSRAGWLSSRAARAIRAPALINNPGALVGRLAAPRGREARLQAARRDAARSGAAERTLAGSETDGGGDRVLAAGGVPGCGWSAVRR